MANLAKKEKSNSVCEEKKSVKKEKRLLKRSSVWFFYSRWFGCGRRRWWNGKRGNWGKTGSKLEKVIKFIGVSNASENRNGPVNCKLTTTENDVTTQIVLRVHSPSRVWKRTSTKNIHMHTFAGNCCRIECDWRTRELEYYRKTQVLHF